MQTCSHSSLRLRGGAPHAFHNSCSQHKFLTGNVHCELGWLKSFEFSLEFRLISIKDSRYWLYIKATEKGKKRKECFVGPNSQIPLAQIVEFFQNADMENI